MVKSILFTSKYLNQNKLDELKLIDKSICKLKNDMSFYVYNNVLSLMNDNDFNKNYTKFKYSYLTNSWENQTLFDSVSTFYLNHIKQKTRNFNIKLQKSMNIQKYKNNTKLHTIGDTKSFELKYKSTKLTKLLKYLIFININQHELIMNKSKLAEIYNYYKEKTFFDKIINLAINMQQRLLKSIKLIKFTTGTHDKRQVQTKIVVDETNNLFKYWLKYKSQSRNIFIPIQVNSDYHNDIDNLIKDQKQLKVKINKNKVNIYTTKECSNPEFKEFNKVVGLDLNVKHNFCFISDGKEMNYDRNHVQQTINSMQTKNTKKIEKSVRRNEFYFKKLISEILNYIESQNITDIVLENLDTFGATFIKSTEFNIKYSKLVRLLRLSNIKTWMKQQAEKRGIRIHVTHAHYSSQQCPSCGNIDKRNRKTQELFSCIECGHTNNADHNSSINLERRFTENVFQSKLHIIDDFNRLNPLSLNKFQIKKILLEPYNLYE